MGQWDLCLSCQPDGLFSPYEFIHMVVFKLQISSGFRQLASGQSAEYTTMAFLSVACMPKHSCPSIIKKERCPEVHFLIGQEGECFYSVLLVLAPILHLKHFSSEVFNFLYIESLTINCVYFTTVPTSTIILVIVTVMLTF